MSMGGEEERTSSSHLTLMLLLDVPYAANQINFEYNNGMHSSKG